MSQLESVEQIVVIDDDEAIRGCLALILEAAGYEVRLFDSADAYLQAYDDCAASCIVTDLCMASIDGVELLRRLNAMGSLLPVIVLTGYADVRIAVICMRLGAMTLLEKPASHEGFLDAVKNAVERMRRSYRLPPGVTVRGLTTDELRVLQCIYDGLDIQGIADKLEIPSRTVYRRRDTLLQKMGLRNADDLIRLNAAGDLRFMEIAPLQVP